MSAIVGREGELERVGQFLASIESRASALHLHGEAGIGKSTIWQRALTDAAERGYAVLSTRPTEAEARLPFAGLNDLLGAAFDELGSALPDPQRRALAGALLRSEVDDANLEPLAISLAVLGLLRAAAERSPIVVAVDDSPWLDESSASTLEFVIRRLDAEPIGLLVAERTSPDGALGRRLLAAVPPERVTEIPVVALTMRQTEQLLVTSLSLELPPSALKRLYRTSGGNPLYAVEIGRALQRRGLGQTDAELPVPDTLAGLLRDRLDALSAAATDVVELASALSQPSTDLLSPLLGADVVAEGVEEAAAANVLAVDGAGLRFTHPLLAAELYSGLGEPRRRDLHRRLAQVVTEPEEHARHVALAADGPDEEVAAELERAAERAHARGAPDAAAALAEQALTLTPDRSDQLRRLRLAARYYLRAGDIAHARGSLELALEQVEPGPMRAGILLQLGEVRDLMDDWVAGEQLLSEALAQVGDDVRLEIQIRLQLGGVSHVTRRNWEAGAQHVFEAMRLAESLGDPAVLARTIGPYATWLRLTGPGYPPELERRAEELEPWTSQLRALDHPLFDFSTTRWAEGNVPEARQSHQALLDRAERTGDYSSIAYLLCHLAEVDVVEGHIDDARDRLERAERLARATGQRTALASVLTSRTLLLARTGQADDAWHVGRAALELVGQTGWTSGEVVRQELALLELSRRSPEAAIAVLEPDGTVPSPSGGSPFQWRGAVHAEALIGVGRLSEARAILDGWREHAPWRESVARMRDVIRAGALLAAAEGNQEEAARQLALAAAAFAATGNPWEVARTRLVAAEVHRRARRRAMARDALVAARDAFDALGARLWSAHASEQLARVVGTRDAEGGLTPTERQVAELVAQGRTNREVGDRLFMSPHTVEAHLTAIYRALDIRSRVELPAALDRHTAGARDSDGATRDSADASDVGT